MVYLNECLGSSYLLPPIPTYWIVHSCTTVRTACPIMPYSASSTQCGGVPRRKLFETTSRRRQVNASHLCYRRSAPAKKERPLGPCTRHSRGSRLHYLPTHYTELLRTRRSLRDVNQGKTLPGLWNLRIDRSCDRFQYNPRSSTGEKKPRTACASPLGCADGRPSGCTMVGWCRTRLKRGTDRWPERRWCSPSGPRTKACTGHALVLS